MKIKCTSCKVDGCQSQGKWFTKLMCNAHYRKSILYGDPLISKRVDTSDGCVVDGCIRPVEGLSYCSMHYQRFKKHGDPLVIHGVRKVRTSKPKKIRSVVEGGSVAERAEVYWIRAEHHVDMTIDGYIGVSKNAKVRWRGHKSIHKTGCSGNKHFANAIAKYGWDNLVKTVILVSNEKYCYEIEKKLRHSHHIGWNLMQGGGKPPISKNRGVDYVSPLKGVSRSTPWCIGVSPSNKGVPASPETRKKISLLKTGTVQTPEHVAKRMISRLATLESKKRVCQL